MMRSIAFGLSAILLLAVVSTGALARGHGGHMGGGRVGGGNWSGHAIHGGGMRNFAAFHGARFHHHRRFFVGYAAYDYGCWRLRPTPWGWRRVWVCGSPYYGYF